MEKNEKVPHQYMTHRIHKVLLVCCSYDGYILEEDGHIESQINQEYAELNMSNPPSFTRVSSTLEALDLLEKDSSYDFILTMYNVGELDVFSFAKIVKERYEGIPVVLMTSFSKDIYRRLELQDRSALDYIFCWHGNTDLITAIIKLIEDDMNAESDILQGGVQSILLVEDSIRYYSTYLPAIYKLVLQQNAAFLKDAFNEQQLILRKRARPKILLATNYADAVALYQKYKENLLGVISDVGFVLHKDDPSSQEKSDAGIDLCKLIKQDNPLMPFLLQSSQDEYRQVAESLGVGFIQKNSKNLLLELSDYISREFAFGDFIFKDPATGEEIGRAHDLREMQQLLATISDEALEYHTSQNHLSKWMYSRGLFPIAAALRQMKGSQFESTEQHRQVLVRLLNDYRRLLGQGVIARFDSSTYSDAIAFARMGEGSLGGKARGLAFINSTLQKYNEYNKYPDVRITIPRTVVVATDYFDQFIKENNLHYIINSELPDEAILAEFVGSRLPEELVERLRAYMQTVKGPLAVRSSSKLEDSHYQPFAGIYSTYMIPKVDDSEQMLRMLGRAIKSVYASVYFAASKAYIASTANLLSEEKMGIIIQDVCGSREGDYFLPTLSGVARSINFYPIGDERPEDGVVNICMGLGKLVVEGERSLRFSPKYPERAFQTSTDELCLTDTQREIYVLDLHPEAFRTSIDDAVNFVKLDLLQAANLRNMKYVSSVWDRESQRISDSPFDKGRRVITFNNILKYNSFPLAAIISEMLALGEEEMRCPVEIEFAANLDRPDGQRFLNILQIRPIINMYEGEKFDWSKVDTSDAILYAENALGLGNIPDVCDVVYLRPEAFDNMATEEMAREILAINARMRDEKRGYVLIGPGRWGSSDKFLGVPVGWAHISEARAIVECGILGFHVDPSQGTHFFQNVTSLGIGYLTLNPSQGNGLFNVAMLDAMPAVEESKYVRVVRFPSPLYLYVDGKNNKGIIKVEKPAEETV